MTINLPGGSGRDRKGILSPGDRMKKERLMMRILKDTAGNTEGP